MVLFSLTTHAQKIDKVRKVDKDKVETIQLKTRASKKQIKAIRKETLY